MHMENYIKSSRVYQRDKRFRFLSTLLLFMLTSSLFAQQKSISGLITDPLGDPVIGASLLVEGTTIGGITDLDGKFTLSNVPESGNLRVSYIGFETQVIPLAGKSQFTITLLEDKKTLDEVIVIGYGSVKRAH